MNEIFMIATAIFFIGTMFYIVSLVSSPTTKKRT